MNATERSAFEVAVDLLARREHAALEIQQKLQRKGFEQEEIEQAIGRLQSLGYQSDERFCEQFVRAKASAGDGPMKIRAALSQRGISNALAQPFLADQDWLAGAIQVSQRRAKQAQDRQQQQKFIRWLAGRGFDYGVIRQVVAHWQASDDE